MSEKGAKHDVGARGPIVPPGPPGPTGVTPAQIAELQRTDTLLRNDITALQKLMQEFSSELQMLGADVEQLKRNLQALSDRVTRLEYTVSRIPRITGTVNIGFRAANANADESHHKKGDAAGAGIGGGRVDPGNI